MFQDPKLGFNFHFTKQELVEGFKNRKGTATGSDINLSFYNICRKAPLTYSWICLILSGSKYKFPFNGRRQICFVSTRRGKILVTQIAIAPYL